tara:strand:- start:2602 stop:3078 length:477 start_codon:yes stop_codon:yes gene_type:complete
MVNYDNALIYTIKTDNGIYVGSTSNLKERRYCHSKCVYNEAAKSYNFKLYQNIRENNNKYKIEIFKMFPCANSEELRKEENVVIKQLNANLNVRKAFASAEDKREYCLKQNVIKTVCECGCITTLGHIARHRKTKKHIKIMKENPSPEKFLKYVEIKD